MATPARLSQEIIAARQMLERAKERFGLQPVSATADKSYGTGEFLSWLSNRQMTPYIPVLDRKQQTKGFYTQHEFTVNSALSQSGQFPKESFSTASLVCAQPFLHLFR